MDQQTPDNKSGDMGDSSQPLERQTWESQDAPPPSYQAQRQASAQHEMPPSYDKTAYLPLPHHKQAPSVTLHVWYESWRKNDIHILDANHANTLYTMKLAIRKPQMTIDSTAAKATIASVTFNFLSRGIDATVNGSAIPLTPRGLLKNGHKWRSAALGNVEFIWKLKGFGLVCEDERGTPVARITFPGLGLRKVGRFDLYGPEMSRTAVVEEILATGLASVEYNAGLGNTSIRIAT